MTFTIKQDHINGYYIELSQEKYSNSFNVRVMQIFKDGSCGFPIFSGTYSTKKNAMASYRRQLKIL